MEHTTFLIHYGELGLKGLNRKDFENRLRKNVARKIKASEFPYAVKLEHRFLTVSDVDTRHKDEIIDILSSTFGIAWFTSAHQLPSGSCVDDISKYVVSLADKASDSRRTFRISAKRADKRYSSTSVGLEKEIGATVLKSTAYEKVDLSNPDDTYYIEIDREAIFVFKEKFPGPGGLPVGTSGKALVLLSGGFDSPVAAYLMAKRGCSVDFLHFYVNEPQQDGKIPQMAKMVSKYTGPGTLHQAPYLPFNMVLLEAKTEYELVLFRRFMLRIGEMLAEKYGYDTLVTGDSLGQVASQTVENISATEDALDRTICLRPLISFDKEEIINTAKDIGIFDIAKEPDKDCCSIIDRHAKTRVTLEKIREEEKKLENYSDVQEETREQITMFKIAS